MILHLDFSTGASGDKICGALLEVGEALGVADFSEMQRLADALVPGVVVERQSLAQGGLRATGLTVTEDDAPIRHWHEIRSLIKDAGARAILSAEATARTLEIFEAIARAEATVHGCDIEHVHFHEVGAADSVIDICFSSFLIDRLAPEAVFATPLALGSGTVVCSHGELPVPAPATARLIEGLPIYAGPHAGEMTTPTGAALARFLVSFWEPLPCVVPQAVGYGGGSRTIPGTPNVVRALAARRVSPAGLRAGTDDIPVTTSLPAADDASATSDVPATTGLSTEAATSPTLETCTLLETNIDHLSPEALAFACEELLASGALDVWQEPITMKKGRLAVRLCVLAHTAAAQSLSERVIALTGSLGVRATLVERVCAPRAIVTHDTRFGAIAFKTALVATPEGRIKLQRPEYEDVARIAREQGLDFNALYEELLTQRSSAEAKTEATAESTAKAKAPQLPPTPQLPAEASQPPATPQPPKGPPCHSH